MSAYYQYNMNRSTSKTVRDAYEGDLHEIAREARLYWRMLRTLARR